MRGATSQTHTEMGGWSAGAMMLHLKFTVEKKKKKWGINDHHKYFSELFECQENYTFDYRSFTGWEAALVLTLWKVFCYNASKWHLFLRAAGSIKQLITFSINIHSILYLKSFKLGWDIESYSMKTVIWVSCLVQRKYQRLLKWSFEYVVHVHVNWMLRYLNNTK